MTWQFLASLHFIHVQREVFPNVVFGKKGCIINPRCTCPAWVTGLGLYVCLSVTMFSATTRNEPAKKRHQRVQRYISLILKLVIFVNAHQGFISIKALPQVCTLSKYALKFVTPHLICRHNLNETSRMI